MRRWRRAAVGTGAVLVLTWASPAVAAAGDAASTHAFLAAATRSLNATIAHQAEEKASEDALIRRVASGCPHVIPLTLRRGTGAQRRTVERFGVASEFELALATIRPLRRVYATFDRSISHLHWTDQALDREIAGAVRVVSGVSGLRGPDLCRQVDIARRSNFSRTPPAIRTLIRRFDMAESGPAVDLADLAQAMRPFANQRDLAAIKRVHRLQGRVDAFFSRLELRGLNRVIAALFG